MCHGVNTISDNTRWATQASNQHGMSLRCGLGFLRISSLFIPFKKTISFPSSFWFRNLLYSTVRSVFNLNKLCVDAHSVDHVGDWVGSPNWILFPAVFQVGPHLGYEWILEMYPKEHSVNGSVGSKDHWSHLYFDILGREPGRYQLRLQVSWYQSSGDRRCLSPGEKQPLKKPSTALD